MATNSHQECEKSIRILPAPDIYTPLYCSSFHFLVHYPYINRIFPIYIRLAKNL